MKKKIADNVFTTLKQNAKYRLEIISHTDCKGDAKANLLLSYKRAKTINDYLIRKGIKNTRLKSIGWGEDEPLNKCIDGIECSTIENELNIRTEFRFYATE